MKIYVAALDALSKKEFFFWSCFFYHIYIIMLLACSARCLDYYLCLSILSLFLMYFLYSLFLKNVLLIV
jgi:hypothetical protein